MTVSRNRERKIWLAGVIACYVMNGGIGMIDPLFETEHGISVISIQSYVIYYGILCLILIPCIIGGKRTFCRCLCWMAPFMIAGTRVRRAAKLPGLHIAADKGCVSCGQCSKVCPMGIDVKETAAAGGTINSNECILCGACADCCPKHVLSYELRYGNDRKKD